MMVFIEKDAAPALYVVLWAKQTKQLFMIALLQHAYYRRIDSL